MDDLSRRLVDRYDDALVSVVLFGSVARGEAGPTSDIDMILVFRSPPRSRIDRFRLFWDALGPLEEERVRLAGQRIAFDWGPIILSVEEARAGAVRTPDGERGLTPTSRNGAQLRQHPRHRVPFVGHDEGRAGRTEDRLRRAQVLLGLELGHLDQRLHEARVAGALAGGKRGVDAMG